MASLVKKDYAYATFGSEEKKAGKKSYFSRTSAVLGVTGMLVISAVIMVHYTGPMVGVGELAVSENAAETEGNTNTEISRNRDIDDPTGFGALIEHLGETKRAFFKAKQALKDTKSAFFKAKQALTDARREAEKTPDEEIRTADTVTEAAVWTTISKENSASAGEQIDSAERKVLQHTTLVYADMYCGNYAVDRKLFKGLSIDECGAQTFSDPECSGTFEYNALHRGGSCYCIMWGTACDPFATSSSGYSVYNNGLI